ncbi:MAG TPA: aminotransferase class IV [Polyangiaceae bacterium]|nr:aminotransferase class IV [Polyangiaceae bacterium]
MPRVPRVAYLKGRVVPFSEASVPLDDRGLTFSESLYEVVPLTGGAARLLSEHVARMEAAAEELGLLAGVPSVPEWERFVAELVLGEGIQDGLVYAQLTAGGAPREFVPAAMPSPTFFAYLLEAKYPRDADVERGISAITFPESRWARRDLKTTMLLPAVLAKREAKRRNAAEAVFVGPDGTVYEGASSNVLLVEGRSLVTPAQSSHLLPGTMRPLVGEAARAMGLAVKEERVSVDRLRAADEVMISSTTQLAMAVVSLDDRSVGAGRGGPITRELARRIRARFELPD